MPTLVELATQIVTAQTSSGGLSTEDIVSSLITIHSTLGQLESGTCSKVAREVPAPVLTVKQAFKKNEIICMICGKSFVTLTKHLKSHGIGPREYRTRFGVPKDQALVSRKYSESLKDLAKRKLADQLVRSAKVVVQGEGAEAKTETVPEGMRKRGRPRKAASAVAPKVSETKARRNSALKPPGETPAKTAGKSTPRMEPPKGRPEPAP